MKYILRLILILCIQISFGTHLYCQIWLSNKDIYDDAEEYLDAEEFVEALPLYMLLEKKDVRNSNISYKIGICYLNIRGQKDKSIPYLEDACQNITFDYQNSIEETKAPLKAIMMLGIAHRINNEPKKAVKIFESLRDTLADNDLEMDAIIDMHIRRCENAILLAAFPGEARTEKLPEQINDEFSNYNPVLVRHDSVLYYMEELKFYDAIMRVQRGQAGWGIPENLTPKVGSDGDHILVGASSDGNQLLLYLYEVLKAGEIYTTRLTEDGWSRLESLNENINTKYHETHASFSIDGKTLYFTSNRPGGYGGLDLYMSEIDDNNDWGPALNLGPVVNTPFNEENPIINADDEILYFSSQGHLNMGGYDIFRAQRKGKNEWRQPINMGSPVSTTDDDLFYFPLEEGVSGLMSRLEKPGNTLYDIYRYNSMVFANSPRFILRGRSETTDSTNYKDQKVLVINSETSDTLIYTNPNPDGSYELLLPAGTFAIAVVDNSGKSSEGTIVFNEGDTDKELITGIQALAVDSVVTESFAKDTLQLKHILFGFDSYKISEESRMFLDELRSWMEKYDSMTFQVIGYTDALGSESYNLRLSRLRAEMVANYLSSSSVDKDRLKIVAKGESNPVAMNMNIDGKDCPEGRRYNRRVEIEPIHEISNVMILMEIEIPEVLIQKHE